MSRYFQFNTGPLFGGGSPRDFTLAAYEPGIYSAETTQRYIPGTRYITWDGRVFKYSRTITSSTTGFGAFNDSTPVNIAVDGTEAVVAGDRVHNLTLDSDSGYAGTGVAEDELAGAFITTGHGEDNHQTRMIVGNDAAAQSTIVELHLEAPWNKTLTDTTAWTEIMLNPYNYINNYAGGGNAYVQGCMGIGVVTATALQYTWLQTYGPLYVNSSGSAGDANQQRSVYVTGDGSCRDGSEITIESGFQMIGFIIDDTSSTSAMPMVMLQISI